MMVRICRSVPSSVSMADRTSPVNLADGGRAVLRAGGAHLAHLAQGARVPGTNRATSVRVGSTVGGRPLHRSGHLGGRHHMRLRAGEDQPSVPVIEPPDFVRRRAVGMTQRLDDTDPYLVAGVYPLDDDPVADLCEHRGLQLARWAACCRRSCVLSLAPTGLAGQGRWSSTPAPARPGSAELSDARSVVTPEVA